MHRQKQALFDESSLDNYFQKLKGEIRSKINALDIQIFQSNTKEHLIAYYTEQHIVEPLVLYPQEKKQTSFPVDIDITDNPYKNKWKDPQLTEKGIQLEIYVPYSGNPILWTLSPNPTYCIGGSNPKRFTDPGDNGVGELIICFEYFQSQAKPEEIQKEIEKEIEIIQKNIDAQSKQLEQYHDGLDEFIESCIAKRQKELEEYGAIIEKLDIPIKSQKGMPDIEPIKVKKRIVRLDKTLLPKGSQPELGISEKIFRDILAILRFMGRTFEETAVTFEKLREEDLRNVFLAALNGYFEGEASGEVFRKNGKTDICIKEKNKAAFIAECKIWHGQSSVDNALNQLLNYATWRDCKLSLVIFNQGGSKPDFSKVLDGIPKAIQNSSRFLREVKQEHNGEWEFIINDEENGGYVVKLHIFAFDIYTGIKRQGF